MINQRAHRRLTILSLLLALTWLLIPSQARAWESDEIPSFEQFVAQVANGEADELRGVYVPGIMAHAIVSQPEEQPAFVSSQSHVLTQYGAASRYDTIALLAHNYLAGGDFFLLEEGRIFYLIYGDGRIETYRVAKFMRFQALTPKSTTSDFVDLETGERLSSTRLFLKVFNRPGDVVLQTCIYANGDASWGRLFIIAEPYDERAPISMPRLLEFQ
ncbi:MAG: hypothetical protein DCC56_09880 [Anaerolineae bacterium]|nr:hypothetical protein [Anaerolineales bacterium]RIK30621.1 MAG: hypothetical protein DCC56_09880 [Anaerolineae bacterium]WKZ45103.1 MAG: hypothetical protein QY302_04860 [Anaerolineales bacterium]